ncbi:PAS domain-containing sensor histidine kinase [Methanolobus psychrotolerans]|uniref:PAS domain-containing sensor histidine kinase n=1 Tax=Methanolobus psychrotolerans TaxID=1874706 RepID=UPI000B91837A|nr:PAS domain S-box protein [Methanolobus psychrotolerans]
MTASNKSPKQNEPSLLNLETDSMDLREDGIVIIAPDGTVSYANKRWKECAHKYGPNPFKYEHGYEKLNLSGETTNGFSDKCVTVAKWIRDIINGTEKTFSLEYPSQTPGEKHWFLMKVQPLSQNHPTGVLLQHIDITERKRTGPDLTEHEKYIHSLLNNIQLAGVTLDPEGNIVFCNDFLLGLTGWKREEVLYKNWFDTFLPSEIIPKIKTVFAKTIEKSDVPSYYKNEIVTKNGKRRLIAWNNTAIKDITGHICSITSIGEDITDRRFAEKSLLTSKGQLRTLVDTIPDLIWLKDVNGIYLNCNPKFERFFGAKEAEIVGKTDYDFVEKDLADFFTKNDKEAMKADRPTVNEEEIIYADDGHKEYLETIKSPMYDPNGHLIGVLGVGRDITQRKHDEEELRKKELQLRTAQNVGRFGSWHFDLNSGNVDASEEALRIYGTEIKQFTIKKIQEIPLPEYRPVLDKALHDLITGKAPYDVHFRIRRQKDGAIRDIHSVAEYFAEHNIIIGTIQDITELKQAENKLLENKALLNEVGRIAMIGGWEFNVVSGQCTWTPEVLKIHELDINTPANNELGLTFYPSGSRESIVKAFQNVVDKGESYDLELEFITAKGNHKWVRTSGRPTIENGKVVKVTGILQDITERKQNELKIEEEAIRRRIFVEQSSDGIVVIDQNGKVFEANQKYADMLGYSLEEVLQLHVWDWDTPQTHEDLLEMIRNVDDSGDHFETRHRRKDGTFLDVEVSSNGAMFGEQKLAFCVCRDITRRKQDEDELRHAKLEAEAANMAKSDFLANMSHELRTPLNSIYGFSQLLNDRIPGELNEKQSQYLSNVLKSSKHLIELINDILDLSKVEAGEMQLCCDDFLINDLIDETVTSMQPAARKKHIGIRTDIQAGNVKIFADKKKMRDIMYNLLSNAVKFTPESGEICVRVICSNGKLQVSVSDNGIGISKTDQLEIFKPFKQVDSFLTRKFGGTGLGLAIVKKYVEMHGGNVLVQSDTGKGSTFTFMIAVKPENG